MPNVNRDELVSDEFRVQIMLDRLIELQAACPEYPGDSESIQREQQSIIDWFESHRYLTLDVLQSDVLTNELVKVLFAVFPDIAEV
jgi:hypothetical protein